MKFQKPVSAEPVAALRGSGLLEGNMVLTSPLAWDVLILLGSLVGQ